MTQRFRFLFIACAILSIASFVQAQSAPATTMPAPKAYEPAPKVDKDGNIQKAFSDKHNKYLARAKQGDVELLFLGDSITEGWSKAPEVWKKYYADKYKTANFGISGDRTQHVLWRIENGELEGIKPKVTVIMIGTNNNGSSNIDSPEDIAKGIERIVKEVREKTGSKVLLLAIFPRGPSEEKAAKARANLKQVNSIISKLDDGTNVRYLDFWDKWIAPDVTDPSTQPAHKPIAKEIMRDALHPSPAGYQIWAENMDPLLTEMMK